MATTRDWALGYLEQARADLICVSAAGAASPSTAAMLWQMVFEKFAKAALLRLGTVSLVDVRRSHRAASKLLHALRRNPPIFAKLGGALVWEDVLTLVVALEAAHPQLAHGAPQLEYPWEDLSGNVMWPARDLHVAHALGDATKMLRPRVLRFANLLNQHFDTMFP